MRMHARYMANGGRLYHMPGMLHALYGPRLHQDALCDSYWPAGMDDHMREPYAVCSLLVPCLWIYQAAIMGTRRAYSTGSTAHG